MYSLANIHSSHFPSTRADGVPSKCRLHYNAALASSGLDFLLLLYQSLPRYLGDKRTKKHEFAMEYSPSGNILKKDQLHKVSGNTQGKTSYNFTYEYNDAKSHAASVIASPALRDEAISYTYDANGNPTVIASEAKQSIRRMAWDEENRMLALADNGNA